MRLGTPLTKCLLHFTVNLESWSQFWAILNYISDMTLYDIISVLWHLKWSLYLEIGPKLCVFPKYQTIERKKSLSWWLITGVAGPRVVETGMWPGRENGANRKLCVSMNFNEWWWDFKLQYSTKGSCIKVLVPSLWRTTEWWLDGEHAICTNG